MSGARLTNDAQDSQWQFAVGPNYGPGGHVTLVVLRNRHSESQPRRVGSKMAQRVNVFPSPLGLIIRYSRIAYFHDC